MKNQKLLLLLGIFILISGFVFAQDLTKETELTKKLKALPGIVEVKAARFDTAYYKEAYEVMFEQPLDHKKPKGEKFKQRFFIGHKGYDLPVKLETEGYSAGRIGVPELTRILGGNEVVVEHRYFGRSVPDKMKWEFLTIKNSADDLHRIVTP